MKKQWEKWSNGLKTLPEFKSINISADCTKRQIEFYKKVKQKLMEKIISGDEYWKIKYSKGIPRVVAG